MNTLNSAENSPKSTSLIEREKIENTPFTAIKKENEWFLVMGDYKISEPTKTLEETIQKLEEEKWLILVNVIVACILKTEQLKKDLLVTEKKA